MTSKNELIEKVFPNILNNYKNNKWLSERAILAPKYFDVHEINNIVLTKIRDQAVLYKSVDSVLEPNEAVNLTLGHWDTNDDQDQWSQYFTASSKAHYNTLLMAGKIHL